MLKTGFIVSILLFLSGAQSVFSQAPQWVPVNGPPNRIVRDIEALKTTLFALTDSGLFLTTNDGPSWKQVSGFYGTTIYQIFKCDTILFVVTLRQQSRFDTAKILNKSTDGGVSWDSIHVGPGYFSASNTGLFYNDSVFPGAKGLFFSSLDGKTRIWIDSENSIKKQASFVRASRDSFIVCIVDSPGAVTVNWRISTDLGKTWRDFTPPNSDNKWAAIAIDENMFFTVSSNGLFRSIDTCRTWQLINSDIKSTNYFEVDNNILYTLSFGRGMYSLDHGFTWKPMSDGLPLSVIFDVTFGRNELYMRLENDGVFRTSFPSTVKSDRPTTSSLSVYPNPLTSEGEIKCSLSSHCIVSLSIYDALGRIVDTPILEQPLDAGEHTLSFDAKALTPGVYHCRLSAGSEESVVKFLKQ